MGEEFSASVGNVPHMRKPHLDGEIRDGGHRMQVRVYYEDTDFSTVVYHANYLRFMERGRTNYLRLLGADSARLCVRSTLNDNRFFQTGVYGRCAGNHHHADRSKRRVNHAIAAMPTR